MRWFVLRCVDLLAGTAFVWASISMHGSSPAELRLNGPTIAFCFALGWFATRLEFGIPQSPSSFQQSPHK